MREKVHCEYELCKCVNNVAQNERTWVFGRSVKTELNTSITLFECLAECNGEAVGKSVDNVVASNYVLLVKFNTQKCEAHNEQTRLIVCERPLQEHTHTSALVTTPR